MEPMIIALDVVGEKAGVAWRTANKENWIPIEDKKPSSVLLPVLATCLSEGEPQKLGVVVGPGSFTGIRTGIATALGLKMSKNLKVFGFHKFELMAFFWGQAGHEQASFLIPNRADRLYACEWTKRGGLGVPGEIRQNDLVENQPYVSTRPVDGYGVTVIAESFAKICLDALVEGDGDPELKPLYIRPADTRTNLTYIEKLLSKGTKQ